MDIEEEIPDFIEPKMLEVNLLAGKAAMDCGLTSDLMINIF